MRMGGRGEETSSLDGTFSDLMNAPTETITCSESGL